MTFNLFKLVHHVHRVKGSLRNVYFVLCSVRAYSLLIFIKIYFLISLLIATGRFTTNTK